VRRRFVSVALAGLLLASAFAAISVSTLGKGDLLGNDRPNEDEEPLEWTIMVYLAGDNNLQFETVSDLAEMETGMAAAMAAGADPDYVNVIALVDTFDLTVNTHYLIVEDQGKINVETGEIACDCAEVLGGECPESELNMGDPATLQAFIENSVAYAPADRYMLILWDHGGGWYGACWDDTSVRTEIDGRIDRLTVDEIGNAIGAAVESTGVHLDVIGFDACLMAMIEVAYEVRDLADYMMASVTGIPFGGWAYIPFIEELVKRPGMSVEELMDIIVDGYVDYYSICAGYGLGGWIGVGLSVIELSLVDAIANAVDALSYGLGDGLESGEISRGTIATAIKSSTPGIQMSGEQFAFPDLGIAASRLADLCPGVKTEAEAVASAVAAAVTCDWVSQQNTEVFTTTGMTIYLPVAYYYTYVDYSYETAEDAADFGEFIYYGLDFVIDTNWDEFILEDLCFAYVAE